MVIVIIHTADSVAAGVAACRLISSNVVSFSPNVVLRDPLFSLNSVSKPRMLSVSADYVLSPLQLVALAHYDFFGLVSYAETGRVGGDCSNRFVDPFR